MKALRFGVLALVVAISGIAHAQNANKRLPDRERLIGAWCLVHIESPGLDGKIIPIPQRKGMLIYTRDGHMSVQLMYPKSVSGISNQYVQNGYEESFGSYEIDEDAHTLTHHVQGSITGGLLVGKNLQRVYQVTADGRLLVRSTWPDEYWFVVWKHY